MPITSSASDRDQLVCRELVLTVDTAAYALGDVVGNLPATATPGIAGALKLDKVNGIVGRSVKLYSLVVSDYGEQTSALTLYVFNQLPTGGTYVDNGPLILSRGDQAKLACSPIKIEAAGYVTLAGTGGVGSFQGMNELEIGVDVFDRDLWVLAHADAAIDYVAGNDVRVKFFFDRGPSK